jgi:hypothetical protein
MDQDGVECLNMDQGSGISMAFFAADFVRRCMKEERNEMMTNILPYYR